MNLPLTFSKTGLQSLFIIFLSAFSFTAVAQTNWNFAAPTDGSGDATAETGKGLCTDAAGNVYMSGVFGGTSDFDLNSATTNTSTTTGSSDGYVVSYDKNGVFRWKTIFGGTVGDFVNFQTGLCTNGIFVWIAASVNVTTGAN